MNFGGGGGQGSVCILFITAPLLSGYTPESQEVQLRVKLEKEGTLSGTYASLHLSSSRAPLLEGYQESEATYSHPEK